MIKDTTIQDLLDEFKSEGIVAVGCGGDVNEWLAGVNNILVDEKVTEKPQAIGSAYKFENEGLTCLLFPFPKEVDDFNIGRLAIVRLQYPWMKWWSDYKDSYISQNGEYDDYDVNADVYDDDYYDEDDDDCPLYTPDDEEDY